MNGIKGTTNVLGFLADLFFGEQTYLIVVHGFNQVSVIPEGPCQVNEVFVNYMLAHLYDTSLIERFKMAF